MKEKIPAIAAISIVLALAVATSARTIDRPQEANVTPATRPVSSKAETTWIFDADFEDLTVDNWGIQDLEQPEDSSTGWYTTDRTGGRVQGTYWHRDTLNAYPDGSPPDTSMWCGKRQQCWSLPRGHGNDWCQHLVRGFDLTAYGGRDVELRFRQQYAMEKDYDYGYVDVSTDSGQTWVTLDYFSDPGYPETCAPVDWDDTPYNSHPSIDLTAWAGQLILLRWRMESDYAVSCEDLTGQEPSWFTKCVEDGAWYVDEIQLIVDDTMGIFHADFEDPSNPDNSGWDGSTPPLGETRIFWNREYNPPTGRDSIPIEQTGWMLTAVDSVTHRMVNGERAYLITPPVTVAGAETLIVGISGWKDFAGIDAAYLTVVFMDSLNCVGYDWSAFKGKWIAGVGGGPAWFDTTWQCINDDLSRYAIFIVYESARFVGEHTSGLYINNFRVGVIGQATGIAAHPTGERTRARVSVSPNPFSESVGMDVTGSACRDVTASVYDLSGRLVRELDAAPGAYDQFCFIWNGTDESGKRLSSGVYFCRVLCDGGEVTKKLILLE